MRILELVNIILWVINLRFFWTRSNIAKQIYDRQNYSQGLNWSKQ